MTKQQIVTVQNLLGNYSWKRGAWQVAILKALAKNEDKRLNSKQLKLLNIVQAQAAAQDRSRVQAQAKQRQNEKRYSRQIGAARMAR